MEYIKDYNQYSDDLIVEKLNLQPLLDKLKNSINKIGVSKLIVGSLLAVFTINQAVNFINNRSDLNSIDKKVLIETVHKYNDPLNMSISENGIQHIKKYEKLKLKAYNLHDGKVTVGFGHAEPIGKSAFRVGQVISEDLANSLLEKDINKASDGVKRIFSEWKQKGINIRMTQKQFDTMVSLAFNMGISSFRTSDFIQTFKHKDFEKAAELIKTTGLRDGYSGLIDRRNSEYQMFIS
jgi:lysozyme